MADTTRFNLRETINLGFIAGIASLCLGIIGMVALFAQRDLIAGVLTLGQVFLFAPPAALGYVAASKVPEGNRRDALLSGLVAGLTASLPLIVLILLATAFDLRQFLPNVSPALLEVLTFGLGTGPGSLVLLIVTSLLGLIAAGLYIIPDRFSQPFLVGLLGTLIIGMFSEILGERLRSFFGAGFVKLLFSGKALKPSVALILFILIAAGSAFRHLRKDRAEALAGATQIQKGGRTRWIRTGLGMLFLLLLPLLLGTYLSEVTNNVLIYVLMGFGLNIVVGFAGLLDLGYVAFFAIGAYTMALLTTTSALGVAGISFWLAIPVCVLVAVMAGVILGIPVLRMRGDYLAIVTLGFGEIIRILALSDLLKPYIGGAQGVLQINKPIILGLALVKPDQFYYVVLAGCLIAAFVSLRLSGARLGRQWMALREDEDVAEAMGINLVGTKLLAFAIGAAFSGLSGAIFASKLTSIFPHSFGLYVSINVLCLIIVGGMGSLPGVVVGALVLVGLPELLREFAEYRYLMYGALLIVMMLARPEGFWPSAVRRRELQVHMDKAPTGGETATASD